MDSHGIVTRLALVALLAPALSTAAVTLVPAAAKKGQVTYERYCVSCHGPTGKGDGPIAPHLRVPVPDLTTLAQRSGGTFPYERVVRIIGSGEIVRAHGTEDMPAWGEAFKKTKGTDERTIEAAIRNLAQYLWSLQPAK